MSGAEEPISFAIRAEHQNGVVRLFASGELDISTAPLLEQWLATVERLQPTTVLVDFAGLTFMDSTGLKLLLQAHELATGGGRAFLVVNGSEGVRRVFELTRTEHLVDSSSLPSLFGAATGDGSGEWSPITMPGADGG